MYSSSNGVLEVYGEGTMEAFDRDSWGDWTVESITVGGEELGDPEGYAPSEVVYYAARIVLSGGSLEVPSYALVDLRPRAASFSDGFSIITEGMFAGCTSLSSVNLQGISSIGDGAFRGCISLTTVDVRSVTDLSLTAFEGCTRLSSLSATGSGTFLSEGGILYSDGGSTLYMCPPAMSGLVELPQGVTRVNLDYADVVHVADALYGQVTFVEAVDGASARGVVYSSLGMSSHSLSLSGDTVVLAYAFYDGWRVDGSCLVSSGMSVTIGDGRLSMALEQAVSSVYPMGVAVLTYEDLEDVTSLGSWEVVMPDLGGSGVIADIGGLEVAVVGYIGTDPSAELPGTMLHRGLVCEVTSVSMSPGAAGDLEELTVGEGVGIGDGAFEYCSSLRSITADYVETVGAGAFRYCTNLVSASFASCTEFGDRAFDGCWSLSELALGDVAAVEFGEDALRSCLSLEMLVVGTGTEVSGTDGVPVVHLGADDREMSLEAVGGYLLVSWEFTMWLTYILPDGTVGIAEAYSDQAVIPLVDGMEVVPSHGQGDRGHTLVFVPGLGLSDEVVHVQSGGTVDDVPEPSALGYTFLYWELDGERFYPSQAVTGSGVLTAVWSKEDGADATPVYIMAIFLVAVAATFGVLAVARRRLRRGSPRPAWPAGVDGDERHGQRRDGYAYDGERHGRPAGLAGPVVLQRVVDVQAFVVA